MDKLEIDDAVNATPVHYFAGFWGLLAPKQKMDVEAAHPTAKTA